MRRLLVSVALLAGAAPALPPRVVPNDNRVPAGTLRGGTLALTLVAREAEWHPDGDGAPGVTMPAFAEDGGPARIPGPLVRVRAGTVAEVAVRNALADTLRVYGLVDRAAPGGVDPGGFGAPPLVVAPGERRAVRLRLDAPGTYLYWGTTTGRPMNFRTGLDAQLTGAIVVDPPGVDPARPRDRVLVLGSWSDTVHRAGTHRTRVLATVNGRAWPHTERLAHAVGDTVRWRVLNGSADLHPVHLHGFHFRVTARAAGVPGETPDPVTAPSLVVTEPLGVAGTLAMEWVPTRAGQWLFHCHVPEHFAARGPLGTARPAGVHGAGHGAGQGAADHALGGMGGMVVGIVLRPRPSTRATPASVAARVAPAPGERRLRLLARATVGSTDAAPTYAYAVHEGDGAEPPPDTGLVASPMLDLVRGAPVRITVVNRLPEPTAVHWHGIELDPYYDGVPGFSGSGRRTTPMIAPGDSFVVRLTPPRAGTFIYHTHADETRQQAAGLAGALVVREPGTTRDPALDVPVVLTSPLEPALGNRVMLFNARRAPAPLAMRVGRTTRLRLVQMSVPRAAVSIRLLGRTAAGDDSVVAWRVLAKDGADLPPAATRAPRSAVQLLAVGETIDVAVTPDAPGELRLEAVFGLRPGPRGVVGPVTRLGVWPIRVAAANGAASDGAADGAATRDGTRNAAATVAPGSVAPPQPW